MCAMNTTNAMCTRNHMMNISTKITLMAITDSCVTIVVRDSSHRSEFNIHRDSVHLKIKDYACNKCQQRAFTSIGRLNAHLAICGKEAKEECGICGKMYSTKETLFTHITDVHKDGVTRSCPFCDEKVYTSEGRYYKHMHVKHNISRNTIKLSDYMKAQGTEDKNSEEDENVEKEDSDSDKKKNKRKIRKNKKEKDEKSENTDNGSKTEINGGRKTVRSEDTEDMEPRRKRRKSETDDVGKKSKNTEYDKKTKKSKDTKVKGNARGTSEPVKTCKSDVETDTKGDSYPAKRTRSSGPVMWDCPFCEDKKYADNLEYLVHLHKAHKCNLPGHAVKKEVKEGKLGKYPKGQGKR